MDLTLRKGKKFSKLSHSQTGLCLPSFEKVRPVPVFQQARQSWTSDTGKAAIRAEKTGSCDSEPGRPHLPPHPKGHTARTLCHPHTKVLSSPEDPGRGYGSDPSGNRRRNVAGLGWLPLHCQEVVGSSTKFPLFSGGYTEHPRPQVTVGPPNLQPPLPGILVGVR